MAPFEKRPPDKPDLSGVFAAPSAPWAWLPKVAIVCVAVVAFALFCAWVVTADVDAETPATVHLRDGSRIECEDLNAYERTYSCDTEHSRGRSYPLDVIEFVQWHD